MWILTRNHQLKLLKFVSLQRLFQLDQGVQCQLNVLVPFKSIDGEDLDTITIFVLV